MACPVFLFLQGLGVTSTSNHEDPSAAMQRFAFPVTLFSLLWLYLGHCLGQALFLAAKFLEISTFGVRKTVPSVETQSKRLSHGT
jgi:hypothetical protein